MTQNEPNNPLVQVMTSYLVRVMDIDAETSSWLIRYGPILSHPYMELSWNNISKMLAPLTQ